MAILNAEKLARIRKHRYRCEGREVLFILDPGFDKITECLPRFISPNGLTIVGILSTTIPCILVSYFEHIGNRQGVQDMSSWCALGFFMWLLCDSIDGKVARLRNLSSPFGELLDHGGDCFAHMLSSITIACLLRVSEAQEVFFMWFVLDRFANYISEPYTMYICGKYQYASFDFLAVVTSFTCISLVSAIYGLDFWTYSIVPAVNFQFRHIFYIVKIVIIADILLVKSRELYNTVKGLREPRMQAMKPLIPLLVVTLSTVVAFCCCSSEFFQSNSILFLLCFGFSFVKIHIQLLLAQMVKSQIKIFDYALLFPIFVSFGIIFCETPKMEKNFIQIFSIITALDTTIYFFRLVYELYRGLYVENVEDPRK
eukprot:gene938-10697_t